MENGERRQRPRMRLFARARWALPVDASRPPVKTAVMSSHEKLEGGLP